MRQQEVHREHRYMRQYALPSRLPRGNAPRMPLSLQRNARDSVLLQVADAILSLALRACPMRLAGARVPGEQIRNECWFFMGDARALCGTSQRLLACSSDGRGSPTRRRATFSDLSFSASQNGIPLPALSKKSDLVLRRASMNRVMDCCAYHLSARGMTKAARRQYETAPQKVISSCCSTLRPR